jgi:hypothetical protein
VNRAARGFASRDGDATYSLEVTTHVLPERKRHGRRMGTTTPGLGRICRQRVDKYAGPGAGHVRKSLPGWPKRNIVITGIGQLEVENCIALSTGNIDSGTVEGAYP